MAKAQNTSAKNNQVSETPNAESTTPTITENATLENPIVENVNQEGGSPESETPNAESTTQEGQENTNSINVETVKDDEIEPQVDYEDEALIARYKKLYPQNKVFHLTSDKQVFLDSGKRDADAHQKTLGYGSLKSYHQHTI
ncbi:MAG: hypothetical protein DI598_16795 [Pseudopedobacter saltans]|uniref:Uncharacterized protein n=1 Tax=Pseudopedobacter saltans TaxID=151895 RepID=A0A2W5EEU6_9SPHI|nr:MAG: hypothetical protein DI598_16795 [Pseudopedobacter saltans]